MATTSIRQKQLNGKSLRNEEENTSVHSSDYVEIINQNQLLDYFKSIRISSISQKKSDFYAYERFINVTEQIYNGDMQLRDTVFNINSLLVKQRISQQQEKSNQLKAKKAEILNQLTLLDDQVTKIKRQKGHSVNKVHDTKSFSMESSRINSAQNQQQTEHSGINKIGKLILSRQQHKKLIVRIAQQRQERQKKRLQFREKQEQKLKNLINEEKEQELKKIEEQKKRKAEQIQEKLKKKKEIHEKFLELQKQSDKKFKELKNKKFLYEQIQQRFEMKIKMPLLQEQKKILRQKRQFAKAYSIDEIKTHEKNYIQLRENIIQKSQAKQKPKSSVQDYKLPLKSSKLQKILEEQKLQQRKKLMEKKVAIEQKLQRQQNYVEYLKQNFSKIKIDKEKEDEIKSRIQKEKVKREQFDSRAIGITYLQEAKKKRKKTDRSLIQKQDAEREQQANLTALSQKSKKQNTVRQSRISEEIRKNSLLKKRQEKIQILIHDSSSSEADKIRKLKFETEKINEAFKMKEEMLKYGYSQKVQDEAVQLLLTSIQAKMGIIDISK